MVYSLISLATALFSCFLINPLCLCYSLTILLLSTRALNVLKTIKDATADQRLFPFFLQHPAHSICADTTFER